MPMLKGFAEKIEFSIKDTDFMKIYFHQALFDHTLFGKVNYNPFLWCNISETRGTAFLNFG